MYGLLYNNVSDYYNKDIDYGCTHTEKSCPAASVRLDGVNEPY